MSYPIAEVTILIEGQRLTLSTVREQLPYEVVFAIPVCCQAESLLAITRFKAKQEQAESVG